MFDNELQDVVTVAMCDNQTIGIVFMLVRST